MIKPPHENSYKWNFASLFSNSWCRKRCACVTPPTVSVRESDTEEKIERETMKRKEATLQWRLAAPQCEAFNVLGNHVLQSCDTLLFILLLVSSANILRHPCKFIPPSVLAELDSHPTVRDNNKISMKCTPSAARISAVHCCCTFRV